MITSLKLINFKNFANESLHIGPFTIIVGSNASGKSNIRDAFRILNGIGCGYNLSEIFGGKHLSGQTVWEPIRGAPNEIYKLGNRLFSIYVNFAIGETMARFHVYIGPEVMGSEGFRVFSEQFEWGNEKLYEWTVDGFKGFSDEFNRDATKAARRDQTILTQVPLFFSNESTGQAIDLFKNIRFLELIPDRMRQPSFATQRMLGNAGENLPSFLKFLCEDQTCKDSIIEWIRELTPMDVEDFDFPIDPSGRVHLIFKERNGSRISAYSASDGTLRFLAMLAALLTPEPPSLYFFEEIDNGIHPSRLHLLVELIETQTAKGKTQVIATTHSPELLAIINDKTFQNTSVVCRREGTNDAIIRPVSEIPNAVDLRMSQGLGRLLAGGWMETALAFAEEDGDSEETMG